jgi:hypothetical protein
MEQQELDSDGLPPLAPPKASDDQRGQAIEARMVARYGAPSIEDYRRAYAAFGAEWPGDEEIRADISSRPPLPRDRRQNP